MIPGDIWGHGDGVWSLIWALFLLSAWPICNIIELDLLLTIHLEVTNLNNYRCLFICGDPVELLAILLLPPYSFIGNNEHSNEGGVCALNDQFL